MSPPPAAKLATRLDDHLRTTCIVSLQDASPRDMYQALALAVRDLLADRWQRTQRAYRESNAKQVHYLSAEFLLGRALVQNLISLELYGPAREILAQRGVDLADLLEQERDPGLGNGGLGRLAACFLESMATLGLPGFGQGIRYEYGIFEQRVVDGQQVEHGDDWLRYGNVWEVARPDERVAVTFYGRVEHRVGADGELHVSWVDGKQVFGVPYDMPVAGHSTEHVNTLRLWRAEAAERFDLAVFNAGDYRQAVADRTLVEAISKVLYPADHTAEGRELRLKQQYFFCCCAIHDILRRFDAKHDDLSILPDHVAIQLNDTHPAVTIAELMRVLVDERGVGWDAAWSITQRTVAYTNHTLMPEALETWPVHMFGHLLPRHLEIIYEINVRHLTDVSLLWPLEPERQERMSLIAEHPVKAVRMANLATVGSHTINGVAALHSALITSRLLPDFAQMYPERFQNKTNGVTPRRWLLACNPDLAGLITSLIGEGWPTDLDRLVELEPHVAERGVRDELRRIKRVNKVRLSQIVRLRAGRLIDPDSLFDVQIKRIHEYKRQLLCAMHAIHLYLRIKAGEEVAPRTVLFGGKAAPGYAMAKLYIRFIHDVARMIDQDRAVRDRLRVVFVPNYSVSLAERLIPAADLSEQISTAGKEASGTGNMKFAMNGALTIGTLDGANVEIREAVGADHFFLFGHTVDQVEQIKASGYDPRAWIARSERLSRVVQLVRSGFFSPGDPHRYDVIAHMLTQHDTYLHCADFDAYLDAQERVESSWSDPDGWSASAGVNIARVGVFSSDRTIREYAKDIWNVRSVPVDQSS